MDDIQYWSVTYGTLFVTETRVWGANNSIVSKNQSWSLMVAHKKVVKNLLKSATKFYEMGKCATKTILWQINVDKRKEKQGLSN